MGAAAAIRWVESTPGQGVALALMDLTAIGSAALVITGLLGAIVAWRRAPGDRESLAVKTQKDVIADMRDLVDELVEALDRCRDRRAAAEVTLEDLRGQQAVLEARLRALGHVP